MNEIKGPFAKRVRSVVALMAVATLTVACSGAPAASPTAKPAEAAKPARRAGAEPAKPAEAAKPAEPAADAAKPAAGVDFAGKTVRLIVGYPPGGGFDSTARLIAPVLQQTIPGNPTIVVEN